MVRIRPIASIPTRATSGSAAFDLAACLDKPIILKPFETKVVPNGIAIAIPTGFVGMICSRSGLAAKFGITVTNAPGIIDSDYRGELMSILTNLSQKDFLVEHGMRIAQLLIVRFTDDLAFSEVSHFSSETERGTDGLGSTGLS